MTKRRKFIVGMGALASGSAAAVGTGAFNFANVERRANMQVAPSDGDAFLALNDTSDYAISGNNNTLQLAFDEDADVTGSGINQSSDYSFTSVFSIRNQGSQPVGVWIEDSRQDGTGDAVNWFAADSESNTDFSTSMEGPGNTYQLDVGEVVYVNITIITTDMNNFDDLPDTVNVKADASQG
jgi:hypothetical protein